MITRLSNLISIVFHPLFILFYLLVILMYVNPYIFGISDNKQRIFIIISILINTVLFPVVSILMLKLVGFVSTLKMEDPKERIGPLIACSIFYLWLYINIKNVELAPPIYEGFVLASVIGLFVAFFINNFTKISLHGIGIGGFLGALFLIRYYYPDDHLSFNLFNTQISLGNDLMLILGILIAGLVLFSRLYLKAHNKQDVYGGFLVGFVAQLIALRFIEI